MKVVNRNLKIDKIPVLLGAQRENAKLTLISGNDSLKLYKLEVSEPTQYSPLTLTWSFPAIDIKGVWTSNSLLDKRIRADWEHAQVSSRVSVDAPVICAFSHDDHSIINVTASDTINTINFEAAIREEDNRMYCSLTFFHDDFVESENYEVLVRIDYRNLSFSKSIQESGKWLEDTVPLKPAKVPEDAKVPLYSTWYSYHQNFELEQLLNECKKSKAIGYDLIIVDDGWQTMDGNRGYDFTGDWKPDRIPQTKAFVDEIHDIGMKVMFWFSVPFCGVKSKAYQTFKGKFLTENHPWAPVFDPRFPEVRQHLISRYVEALEVWGLDGFKLDFIDDFKVYPETEMRQLNGRDVLSVNKGIELLIIEIQQALTSIKQDVLIEFRQKYISPTLRHLGNMFRAFDCPYDAVMNRVRTTDVKLLCGNTAVHSDMLTWHPTETVEIAALQFTSILFSVPQISVRMDDITAEQNAMIKFYTQYWKTNRSILLEGNFTAHKPLSNYPVLTAENEMKIIYGIYDDSYTKIDTRYDQIDIINGKLSEELILDFSVHDFHWTVNIYDCMGQLIVAKSSYILEGLQKILAPKNGLVQLTKKQN